MCRNLDSWALTFMTFGFLIHLYAFYVKVLILVFQNMIAWEQFFFAFE